MEGVAAAPLGVVFRRLAGRIAARVRSGGESTRVFAACADVGLRRQIEAAVVGGLPGFELGRVEVDGAKHGAWNAIHAAQQAAAAGPTLWAVEGFGRESDPSRPDADRPGYRSLNLAREALGRTGGHLLFWLDGVGELGPLARHAPDLWSRRNLVVAFFSEADVDLPRGEVGAVENLEQRFAALEREQVALDWYPTGQAQLLRNQAKLRWDQGRYREALALVDAAEVVSARIPDGRDREDAWWRNLFRRVEALDQLSRRDEAQSLLAQALERKDCVAGRRGTVLRLTGDILSGEDEEFAAEGAYAESAKAWSAEPDRWGGVHLAYHQGLSAQARGRMAAAVRFFDAAEALLEGGATQDEVQLLSGMRERRGVVAVTRGAAEQGLADEYAALRIQAALGSQTLGSASSRDIAEAWWTLGLTAPALAAARRYLEGAEAQSNPIRVADALRKLGVRLSNLPGDGHRAEARVRLEQAVAEYTRLLEGRPEPEQRVSILRWLAYTLFEELAPIVAEVERGAVYDRAALHLRQSRAEALALGLRRLAAEANRGLARLHRSVGDLPAARLALADALADAPLDRLPSLRAHLLDLGAEIEHDAGAPKAALTRAAELLLAAEAADNVWRLRDAWVHRGRAHAALGRPAEALSSFEAARALLRAEGLLPAELGVLHTLSELSLVPGDTARRRAAAEEALQIAVRIAHPREEARALLNVARLTAAGGDRLGARRALDEALELTHELGPPQRLRDLESLAAELAEP